MIEAIHKPNNKNNVLGFRCLQKLTDEDYQNLLIPALDKAIKESDNVRVLLQMDEDFHGWEPMACWDDAKFGIKYRNHFEKIAVVGAPNWVNWGISLGDHFMKGAMKTFSPNEIERAWTWIKN